ncbi:hypothetical protein GCK32_014939 [Trichostrongylus colubriformis]|uniref:Uncharacterized protein n=1 Tax=Trichostrongylus colubriformis TaxID=6319 RepID=A0AAN8FEH0_TRICO
MLVKSSPYEEMQFQNLMETSRYNSNFKVRRVMAYALKFLKRIYERLHEDLKERLKSRLSLVANASSTRYLTAQDIADAEIVLVRNHQDIHLRGQYRKDLTSNLNLKKDEHDVWRAYARMNQSDLDDPSKNPIMIALKTELNCLIIAESHDHFHKSTVTPSQMFDNASGFQKSGSK